MSETILVEVSYGDNHWSRFRQINNAEIQAFRITPQQVLEYVETHSLSPLERLFIPRPLYRVLHRRVDEVGRAWAALAQETSDE